ncbi:MFS transporter [Actinokineospora enzanensis]|uniref:MFS transporter n=1 Tax=Actinokineospora enzanensis TaxID=155975 RepID=UPI00039989B7|nr:MFS transporter [Actinokineospora enzanensis]
MTSPQETVASGPSGSSTPARGRLVLALVLAVAAFDINSTMLAPALPDVISQLHTSSGLVGLSQTLFFLFAAVGQVTLARLSDYLGRRPLLVLSMIVLIVGELACIFAPNIAVFLVGRSLQGISAASYTLSYLIMRDVLPPKQFGRGLGIITAVSGGIAGLDVIIAGWVADAVGFRGIFLITLAVTVVALVALYRWVPDSRPSAGGKMDWKGAALLGVGLSCLLLAVNQGSDWGWGSPAVIGLLIVGVLALVAFPLVEKRVADPVIDTASLASRQVWPLLLATVCTLAGVFGMLNFTIPLLTQAHVGYGLSAIASAVLFLTPASILGIVAAPIAGHFGPHIGWLRSVRIGVIGTTVAFVPFAFFLHTPWIAGLCLAALGITFTGYTQTALTGLSVEAAPADKPGSVPGINGACFGLGASLGIAVAANVVTGMTTDGEMTFAALQAAVWCSGGFVVLGMIATLLLKPRIR